MNLGVQIVSFSVMLTIAFVYFTNKHIKLLSTRIYTLFLSVSLVYSFMEVFTIYTLYNIDTIPPWKLMCFNKIEDYYDDYEEIMNDWCREIGYPNYEWKKL